MADRSMANKEDASIRFGKGARALGGEGLTSAILWFNVYTSLHVRMVKHPGRDLLAFTALLNLLNLMYPPLPHDTHTVLLTSLMWCTERRSTGLFWKSNVAASDSTLPSTDWCWYTLRLKMSHNFSQILSWPQIAPRSFRYLGFERMTIIFCIFGIIFTMISYLRFSCVDMCTWFLANCGEKYFDWILCCQTHYQIFCYAIQTLPLGRFALERGNEIPLKSWNGQLRI